jgi:hypothetical protein
MTTALEVRGQIVRAFRRDLVGPGPEDGDLDHERLNTRPSWWYLSGFLAPAEEASDAEATDPSIQDEANSNVAEPDATGAEAGAPDDSEPEEPSSRRRFLPSSVGLTVLLDPDIAEITAHVNWGDYRTEPPLSPAILTPEPAPTPDGEAGEEARVRRPDVHWLRAPKSRDTPLKIIDGRGRQIPIAGSAAEQHPGGGLCLETHSRVFAYPRPGGGMARVRALTVFLINRRAQVHRLYADIAYAFQARLELRCPHGFLPRQDMSAYRSEDQDLRIADLHYRDVREWAVGRNAAAGWDAGEDAAGRVTRVWTDPLPQAEVERVAPNEDEALRSAVTFGMERLAEVAEHTGAALAAALERLPSLYGDWIAGEAAGIGTLAGEPRRAETARRLIADMETARARIAAGIAILARDDQARLAFRFMNLALARAARRRDAARDGRKPEDMRAPAWRPFQLAFILLNLAGLTDKAHPDRELADLLFFPTGGGKTEAYLGLAAFVIALRRIKANGVLGAGVAVIMRYTLRLLTLDQLSRAAGVICALELMRDDPVHRDSQGRRLLGDWPIEIGLWVGSDASPNRLGGKGNSDARTAVVRVRRFRTGSDKRAPAPIKACPWCGTAFTAKSFSCTPNDLAPTNLRIHCANNTDCDFGTGRALPLLTVDEPVYRRLPAFLIATLDKFAALPWVAETGAFFGHVDRFQEGLGFFGAAEPGRGRPLGNGWSLDPPDLVIQDELHLISGPLGTIAGLYESAIDQLASREIGGRRIRPKIIASTATVRRARDQIAALFDRQDTAIFPPPGPRRTDSFFARTVPASRDPARLYMGIAAQGRGPKLVFLRALTTLLAAGQAAFEANAGVRGGGPNPADPYMTALCYFNALRELGGARRIVEDEVRHHVGGYGAERRRLSPADHPFANRGVKEPVELTSRETTDKVARSKQRLEMPFGGDAETVDVALATNMISVGLDITRLGLMLVQGQPKTAAEYIQSTSRVGRDHNRPGLVLAVLNLHKPRDRMHFEQFGQFHRSFYRAVEATSVTPWAARALDRALAAVIVATTRHLDPAMTPEAGVARLADHPEVSGAIRRALEARTENAPSLTTDAGLGALVDSVFHDWIATVDEQTAGGSPFAYARGTSPHHLLHMPLAREAGNLSPAHRRFLAGRSMRDVESAVAVKVSDPWGMPIANADDV